jgi:murein L,D-transpeptidase YcbB/YkuD
VSNLTRLFMQYLSGFIFTIFLTLSFADSIPEYMSANNPIPLADKNYILLQAELARYELASQKPWPTISTQRLLKRGMKNDNIPLLREQLIIAGDLRETTDELDNHLFDGHLAEAVRQFQTRHGLKADGVVGSATLVQLNISPEERMRAIQVNMQRWATLSKQLGNRFILVNIPDYQLYLFDDGRQVMTMKAIVGKTDWQTPELSSRVTRIVLNPYWNVPDKIASNDLAPKVRSDPYYLNDMNIKVFIRNGTEEINSGDVDWESVRAEDSQYLFRQEPGDGNALGQIKFEFPNTHNVYLHDTPAKSLFEQPLRALSHGCIRLERPLDLADYLMKDDPDWSDERIQEIIYERKTKTITYITVWADENGMVNYRDDVYKRDF